MTKEEEDKIVAEIMAELDEMLAEHERYKEEYGKRRANLTSEQIRQLDFQELCASYDFAVKSGMAIETVKTDDDEDWRLSQTDDILLNKQLQLEKFVTQGQNDHEHCYFCWQKITDVDAPDCDLDGYCFYSDQYNQKIWVCKKCFAEFKRRFNWTVKK